MDKTIAFYKHTKEKLMGRSTIQIKLMGEFTLKNIGGKISRPFRNIKMIHFCIEKLQSALPYGEQGLNNVDSTYPDTTIITGWNLYTNVRKSQPPCLGKKKIRDLYHMTNQYQIQDMN